MMVSSLLENILFSQSNVFAAYGDMNLFCSCSPVDSIDDITGSAAPAPT